MRQNRTQKIRPPPPIQIMSLSFEDFYKRSTVKHIIYTYQSNAVLGALEYDTLIYVVRLPEIVLMNRKYNI